MSDKLNQLRNEYTELKGTKPFNGWKEDVLAQKIAEMKGPEPNTPARAFVTEENARSVERAYQTKGYKTKVKQADNGRWYLYIAKK